MHVIRGFTRIAASALCALLAAQPFAFAEKSPAATHPPVEHASFHHQVHVDEDISILSNRYPPNGDSGFHTHFLDHLYVAIQPAQVSGQSLGKPLAALPAVPMGAAGYGAMGNEPRTHRIVNSDKGVAHFIVIELRRARPAGTPVSSRESAPQYVQIVDNPRLRAWRLTLEPGQSVPAITQGSKGVQVVVRGGLLTTIRASSPDQVLFLRPGDYAIQPAGATRALKNAGTETIELVEMELK
jgi:quercetin dioxygenase-like cupin family protein